MRISFSGPDGSGKSTIVEEVKSRLSEEGYVVGVKHHRPEILPNLSFFIGKGRRDEPDSSGAFTPHSGVTTSRFSSLFRLIYYWLDYIQFMRNPYIPIHSIVFEYFVLLW